MKTKIPHFCPEWDYALIKPDDAEWESCNCKAGEEVLRYIDKLAHAESLIQINPIYLNIIENEKPPTL